MGRSLFGVSPAEPNTRKKPVGSEAPVAPAKPPTVTAADLLQAKLLQGVSRTFALTIPQLPAGLNRVVSNAYLLCRSVYATVAACRISVRHDTLLRLMFHGASLGL
jgi:hypothetical protein